MQWSAISFTLTRFFISLLKLLAISHYLSWLRASVAQTGKFLATVYPKFYTSKTKVIVSIQAVSNATFEVNCFSDVVFASSGVPSGSIMAQILPFVNTSSAPISPQVILLSSTVFH